MTAGESPAVARRRVRLALRAAREAKGFTQGHVAHELDWSLSKVNRIEKGDVTVSRTDLLAMLEMYGVDDQEVVDDFVRAVRTSRQHGWWDDPRYREQLTPAMSQLFQFESGATAIRFFAPVLVPGMLQTPPYASFIYDFWKVELPESVRQIRQEVRLRRRQEVLGSSHPPQYLLILDESVLYREVGGPVVTAEQLLALLDMTREHPVTVKVVRFADATPLAMLGQFTIIDLDDEENAVLYREEIVSEKIESGERVARYREQFEKIWERAMTPEASARLIQARAASMLSSADRLEELRPS